MEQSELVDPSEYFMCSANIFGVKYPVNFTFFIVTGGSMYFNLFIVFKPSHCDVKCGLYGNINGLKAVFVVVFLRVRVTPL